MNMDFSSRGERFCDSVDYIRAMTQVCSHIDMMQGRLASDADMLPKTVGG